MTIPVARANDQCQESILHASVPLGSGEKEGQCGVIQLRSMRAAAGTPKREGSTSGGKREGAL